MNATLGTQHLRYKIAQKNGLTARTALCYKTFALIRTKNKKKWLIRVKGRAAA